MKFWESVLVIEGERLEYNPFNPIKIILHKVRLMILTLVLRYGIPKDPDNTKSLEVLVMSVKMAILNLCQVWEVLKHCNYKLYAYTPEGYFFGSQLRVPQWELLINQ